MRINVKFNVALPMKIRNNRYSSKDRIRVTGNKRLRDSRYPILIDEGTIHNPISE